MTSLGTRAPAEGVVLVVDDNYVLKPVLLDEYLATIRAIEQLWMGLAALPGRPP